MGLAGVRIAILVENEYQDLELWYPLLTLKDAGAEVIIVGPRGGGTYRSKNGYPVKAHRSAAEMQASDLEALVIPGGWAPDLMRRHPEMVRLVQEAHAQGKIVAAICHAGWLLITAGILKGKRVTGFHSIAPDLRNAGAIYLDEKVVRHGNLITSRVPEDLPAFTREIIAALEEAKVEEKAAIAELAVNSTQAGDPPQGE